MTHAKRGYVLFLLFTILSVCSVLISLYFSQVVVYRQLMYLLITKEKTTRLAQSGISLVQALITPEKQNKEEAKSKEPAETFEQKLLQQVFNIFNKQETYALNQKIDGIDGKIKLSLQFEQGKLNLNSLFDFEKKKFIAEGQAGDRKKLCIWLFERIAALTKHSSLFPAFEKHLMSRSFDFNDVTELLSISEFAQAFDNNVFLFFTEPDSPKASTDKVFLTDIFTVSTEQETINPWLFSQSWCKILNLQPKQKLNPEEKKKIFSTIAKTNNWQSDWDKNLKEFYQKEYKDIASEIKTILTTEFEANIFSLLLKVNIGETNSTIFTIVKSKAKDRLISFEIIKTYQI
jgi:hypothetical protein